MPQVSTWLSGDRIRMGHRLSRADASASSSPVPEHGKGASQPPVETPPALGGSVTLSSPPLAQKYGSGRDTDLKMPSRAGRVLRQISYRRGSHQDCDGGRKTTSSRKSFNTGKGWGVESCAGLKEWSCSGAAFQETWKKLETHSISARTELEGGVTPVYEATSELGPLSWVISWTSVSSCAKESPSQEAVLELASCSSSLIASSVTTGEGGFGSGAGAGGGAWAGAGGIACCLTRQVEEGEDRAPSAAQSSAELAEEDVPVNSASLLCRAQCWDAAQIEQNVSSPKVEEACCIPRHLTHRRCLSCEGSIPPQDMQEWNFNILTCRGKAPMQ
ncbi:UNVERIFIED_CONTAM: hypothetical protein FKN15_032819 [Acipenser sinensis]